MIPETDSDGLVLGVALRRRGIGRLMAGSQRLANEKRGRILLSTTSTEVPTSVQPTNLHFGGILHDFNIPR